MLNYWIIRGLVSVLEASKYRYFELMTALALRFGSLAGIDYFRYEYAIHKDRERESKYFSTS